MESGLSRSYRITYENKTVRIPRCRECKALADERWRAAWQNFITVALPALGIAIVGSAIFGVLANQFAAFIVGLVVFSLVLAPIAFVIIVLREPAKLRRYSDIKDHTEHPEVKALLRSGAAFGHGGK
jgi:hypothetical protein